MAEYIQRKSVVLRILGEDTLDFEAIRKEIPLNQDKILRQGERINFLSGKVSKYKAECDVILYEFEPRDNEPFYDMVRRKIKEFLPYKEYIASIKNKYYISIRLSLTSDYAQMYCELPRDILMLISELGVNLEISILSFGEVMIENASLWDKIAGRYRNLCKTFALSMYNLKTK